MKTFNSILKDEFLICAYVWVLCYGNQDFGDKKLY